MLGVALQFVVPPTMLALLFEEAVTVAGLHEGSSSLISGDLGLVGGYDRDGDISHPNEMEDARKTMLHTVS